MSRVCELTGKRPMSGHNVSHSMVHTKRRFLPNLQEKSLYSDVLGRMVSLRLSTNAMRTIDKYGSLDAYMTGVKNRRTETFSGSALRIRKEILRKTATETNA